MIAEATEGVHPFIGKLDLHRRLLLLGSRICTSSSIEAVGTEDNEHKDAAKGWARSSTLAPACKAGRDRTRKAVLEEGKCHGPTAWNASSRAFV